MLETWKDIWQECWPQMGHPDEIRYRFADRAVIPRRRIPNEVRVEIHGQPL